MIEPISNYWRNPNGMSKATIAQLIDYSSSIPKTIDPCGVPHEMAIMRLLSSGKLMTANEMHATGLIKLTADTIRLKCAKLVRNGYIVERIVYRSRRTPALAFKIKRDGMKTDEFKAQYEVK